MNLTALPAFADNCISMLDDGARAIVVDPGEPGPVADALDARRLDGGDSNDAPSRGLPRAASTRFPVPAS